jgi:hypothetical protein
VSRLAREAILRASKKAVLAQQLGSLRILGEIRRLHRSSHVGGGGASGVVPLVDDGRHELSSLVNCCATE